ncbi:MAG: DNA mismatch repair protein MutS [Bacteriovoracia bacterium]
MSQPTLADLVATGIKLTPMMEQYWSVKKQYPGILLFFRMGDFYEMFFEDAREVARLLNISLTVRGKLGETPIPMAGIPHHAAAAYVDRLSQMGLKVVICEQLENPKDVKGIVKRGVTQIASPAVPFDLDKSSNTENKYIACAWEDSEGFLLCLLDFTTGDFFGLALKSAEEIAEKLLIYRPKEFISTLGQWEKTPFLEDTLQQMDVLRTHLSREWFEPKHAAPYLEKLIPGFKRDGIIQARASVLAPLGALSWYISSTQTLEKMQHIRPFRLIAGDEGMKVTWATLRGLEIFPRDPSQLASSLVGFMDRTKSSMGARHLKHFFQTPLKDLGQITKRQDLIAALIAKPELMKAWRETLSEVRDLDRIMAKAATKKANAGDVTNLARTLEHYFSLETSAKVDLGRFFPTLEKKEREGLTLLAQEITATISDELGASAEKGNLIRTGVSKERDRLSKLSLSAADELLALEARYRMETGITNLKVKSNNLAGFFIEISNSHLGKVPKSFQRKQTLTNGERFQTEELAQLEVEITSAEERLSRLEREIFDTLLQRILALSPVILDVAKRLAQMDVYQSLAWVSLQEGFVRPELSHERLVHIEGAWHPLIRANIPDRFVAHNIKLTPDCPFALITGPNMAGKTTVMREVALIQYLAQLGTFVPATAAKLGVRDYLFSRLGASDDIIRGQSTFMVEMSETAEILRHATADSLIILDEIGRGTSTYDGLSIAWALVEWFATKLKSLTLFATHYHELIELVDTLPAAKNLTVRTEQHQGKVQFMYELIEAGATQSFGIHVAELAGLPRDILKRARGILSKLEEQHRDHSLVEHVDPPQLSLFQLSAEAEIPDHLVALEKKLKSIDVMNLTPLQALQTLHDMKSQLQS